ncbi:energy-coupling factor transporter transmembrane protein EcfT [Clostridia bacterium]|nr:energy-coupling factor transporter transmembrane protein EcfT [Clostridia bacterium]
MLKDITLGQYFPGNSIIHRLDPRVKLILTLMFVVSLFLARGVWGYLLNFAWLAFAVGASRLDLRVIFRGMKPLVFILAFTAILNLFYTPGEELARLWVFKVTREGISVAAFMLVRILMLVTATFLLTYTTSPMMLTDALERLLSPLKRIKIPVHELAMMMTIALRMIPTLIEETEKIMSAQRARGADFESGNLLRRAKALIPLLVPLFVSAFRRADDLAMAMECRCYHGGEGRTRMRQLHAAARDGAALLITLGLAVATCLI